MQTQHFIKTAFSTLLFCVLFIVSCSKKSDISPGTPDPCLGKTIVITATSAASGACGNSGSITVTATGSTNFTYKVHVDSTYRTGPAFNNLSAGSYTVYAKDGDGCVKTTPVTIDGTGTAGTLFTKVKSLIAARCQSCHNNANANGGMNFEVQCNIISNKGRIKIRAVDEGTMPANGPLSQADRDIISNWINAGGGYGN